MQTKDNQANARRAEQATDNWMDKSTYEFAAISVLAPLESSRRFLPFYEVEEGHLLWANGLKHKSTLFQLDFFRSIFEPESSGRKSKHVLLRLIVNVTNMVGLLRHLSPAGFG